MDEFSIGLLAGFGLNFDLIWFIFKTLWGTKKILSNSVVKNSWGPLEYVHLDQWFSTFFGQRHTFHHNFFAAHQKLGNFWKLHLKTSISALNYLVLRTVTHLLPITTHNITCISHFLQQKWLKIGKIELK